MYLDRDIASLLTTLTIISLENPVPGYINDLNVLKPSVTTINTLEYLITALICDDMH